MPHIVLRLLNRVCAASIAVSSGCFDFSALVSQSPNEDQGQVDGDAGTGNIETITVRVTNAADDEYEEPSGLASEYNDSGKSTHFGHWMGRDESTGLRFLTVAVPTGAIILSATLTVTATSEDDLNNVSGRIHAKASDHASPWENATNLPTQPPLTTIGVDWNTGPWTPGSTTTSPDFSMVVQEVVNRPGWVSGNSIAIVLMNHGTTANADRGFATFESGRPAALTVSFR